MDDLLLAHVVHGPYQLPEQEPAGVLAHASHALAQVEHEAAADVFHRDVDDVLDLAPGRLDNGPICAVVEKFDNILVIHPAQDLDLLLDVANDFGAALQVLRLNDLDGNLLVWVLEAHALVHLGGVAGA